jgi:plasmid stability protein
VVAGRPLHVVLNVSRGAYVNEAAGAQQAVSWTFLAPSSRGAPSQLSLNFRDSIWPVKQLLLRVPEDIHRRLAARAQREGRSINAVATEILNAAAEGDQGDRRTRLRAAAAAAGTLRALPARPVSAARRRRIIASTRGLGRQVDRLLAQERERG